MERRSSGCWQRFLIAPLLMALVAVAGCTRGERPAPPAGGDTLSAASRQPSSKLASPPPLTAVGFDSLIKQQLRGASCYASSRYVVVERELDDQVGADLYVRTRGTPDTALRCDADSLSGDIVFRTGEAASHHPDAQHFLGLKGDLLVAWDGTGARSDLYIYDLRKRAKVLMIGGVDENLEWLSPMTVAVWITKAYAERAVAAGCPDTIPGNPAVMDSLMSLDLEKLSLRPTGRSRCAVGQ